MDQKTVSIIGKIATVCSILMYVSYIAQIQQNLAGNKGAFLQPFVACINCIFWTIYGFYSKPKSWPLIWANAPGIILAAITAVTCVAF